MARERGVDEKRLAFSVITVVVIAIAVLVPLLSRHLNAHNPSTAAAKAATRSALAEATQSTPAPPSPTITIPPAGRLVLFLGDSYTEGYGAMPEANGYAYLLTQRFGWNSTILGIGGSGWINPGPQHATYSKRIAAIRGITPSLVVLQGGLNDKSKATPAQLQAAVSTSIKQLRAKYPGVQIVLFGPVNPQPPVQNELGSVDVALRLAAQADNVPYISPISERWQVWPFMNNPKIHPNNEGYQYIADHVAADLRLFSVPHAVADYTPPPSTTATPTS